MNNRQQKAIHNLTNIPFLHIKTKATQTGQSSPVMVAEACFDAASELWQSCSCASLIEALLF